MGVRGARALAVGNRLVARLIERTAVWTLPARRLTELFRASEKAAVVAALRRILQVVVVAQQAVLDHVIGGRRRRAATAELLGGQAAIVSPDRVDRVVLESGQQIELAPLPAVGPGNAGAAAAAGVAADAHVDARRIHVILEHDIDHACDRIRAVQRRLATRQDVDMVNQVCRNTGDVVEHITAVVQRREITHRPAIDEVLDVARAETEQADRFSALSERRRALLPLHRTGGERRGLECLCNGAEAFGFDVICRDRGHGSRRFDLGLRNQRTRDVDRFQFLGLFGRRTRGILGGTRILAAGCLGVQRHGRQSPGQRCAQRNVEQLPIHRFLPSEQKLPPVASAWRDGETPVYGPSRARLLLVRE